MATHDAYLQGVPISRKRISESGQKFKTICSMRSKKLLFSSEAATSKTLTAD
jgi:hypothetical protein